MDQRDPCAEEVREERPPCGPFLPFARPNATRWSASWLMRGAVAVLTPLFLWMVTGCSKSGGVVGTWRIADCQDLYVPASYEFRSNGTYTWREEKKGYAVLGRYYWVQPRLELQQDGLKAVYELSMVDGDTMALKEQYRLVSFGALGVSKTNGFDRWCNYRRVR